MNYLIPVMIKENYDHKMNKYQLDSIIDEQIIISQLSNGITFTDTDNMDNYERSYVIQKLIQLKKEENEARKRAFEEARSNK